MGQIAFGQSDQDKALDKMQQALESEEEGKFDPAIKLLEEAQKLDPKNITYPYETAYAYYAKDDYAKSSQILKGLLKHKDVDDLVYQLLGNCYDDMGNTDKAVDIYKKGLKKFPKSGELYLEMGVVQLKTKDFDKALGFFEKGIEVDPVFPSNYYWAATLYCNSTEEIWGMMYGEIFMNLESNTKRTATISKLLYDTYKSQIKFTSDSTMTVSFCKRMTINTGTLSDSSKIQLPFSMVYEPTLLMSLVSEKKIDMASLDRIRTHFVENFYKMGQDKKYPNILIEYQDTILKAGHMEAYNHWLLMKGDEDAFDKWKTANKEKWDTFVTWFSNNKIRIDNKHKFCSGNY